MALIDSLKASVGSDSDEAQDSSPGTSPGPALCRSFHEACKRGDYDGAFEALEEAVACCGDGGGTSLAIMLGGKG